MLRVDLDHAAVDLETRHAVEQRKIHVLAQREHDRVGFQRLELAGRLRHAFLVERHLLDRDRRLAGFADRREPFHQHAFLQRFLEFGVVRRHLFARAPVDDHRLLGAESLGRPRDVERGVAAAVNHHAAPKQRPLLAFHAAQDRDRVEHLAGAAGGQVSALGDVCADGQEHRVEVAVALGRQDVVHFRIQFDRDAERDDARDLGIEHFAWQPVLRDAEAHHAAGERTSLADRHGVPGARELVRGR